MECGTDFVLERNGFFPEHVEEQERREHFEERDDGHVAGSSAFKTDEDEAVVQDADKERDEERILPQLDIAEFVPFSTIRHDPGEEQRRKERAPRERYQARQGRIREYGDDREKRPQNRPQEYEQFPFPCFGHVFHILIMAKISRRF